MNSRGPGFYLVDRLSLDPGRTRGWAIAHALAWNGSPEMIDAASFLSLRGK